MKWIPCVVVTIAGCGVVCLLVWRHEYGRAVWAAIVGVCVAAIFAPDEL